MSGKVCLRLSGRCQKTFENKKFVGITQQCFALLPQINFPDNNLNFHWRQRWWDQIQAIFFNIFYFKLKDLSLCQIFYRSDKVRMNLWSHIFSKSATKIHNVVFHPWILRIYWWLSPTISNSQLKPCEYYLT